MSGASAAQIKSRQVENMQELRSSRQLLTRLMFRLLPIQIFIAAIGAVNGIVSSYFASNYIGVDAMSAVGLYGPINIIMTTMSSILVSGASIQCGKYMGQNEQEKMHNVFTVGVMLAVFSGALFSLIYIAAGSFDLTGIFTHDDQVRAVFNSYLLGQAVGLIPYLLGSLLTFFLSIENKTRWSFAASFSYIAANLLLNYLFVRQLRMEAFGLALASGLGMWVFLLIQAAYYMTGKSQIKLRLQKIHWSMAKIIIGIGVPSASINLYQSVRGFIVNGVLEAHVGSVGISAFATANNLLALFWAIPTGMIAVSRMELSISIGEEDRQTLTDIMRVMFTRFIPVMCIISAAIMACAVPMTHIFFKDPSEPVFMMTVWGLRLLPVCMPLAIVLTHFVTYSQASDRLKFVHIASALDGFVWVSLFTAVLVPLIGMNGVYWANILNGIAGVALVFLYSCFMNKKIPSDMDELMVIPDDFGVAEDERMDRTIYSMEDVIDLSQQVQAFCLERGVDERRSYLAGLAMEEMAGNIVDHGFTKDKKKHRIDVRVAHKEDEVMLRLRDDCIPFDPEARKNIIDSEDPAKNIGIRMIYRILKSVEYQKILGLNVLMMRI